MLREHYYYHNSTRTRTYIYLSERILWVIKNIGEIYILIAQQVDSHPSSTAICRAKSNSIYAHMNNTSTHIWKFILIINFAYVLFTLEPWQVKHETEMMMIVRERG